MMDTKHKVRLHSGYVLRVADLMAPVEIAEDFTLGALCESVNMSQKKCGIFHR
jgi:hypothetical protein